MTRETLFSYYHTLNKTPPAAPRPGPVDDPMLSRLDTITHLLQQWVKACQSRRSRLDDDGQLVRELMQG